jgi:hypothetical protein
MIPSGKGGSAKWQYENNAKWITSSIKITTLIALISSGEGKSAICNMKIM